MRTLVTAQLALGVALLFGSSYFALSAYLEPALEQQARGSAVANAQAVSAEGQLAWRDWLAAQRMAVSALAQSQVLRTLGGDGAPEDRAKRLSAGLASAQASAGASATVALFDTEHLPLGGGSAEWATLPGVEQALLGETTVRVESLPGGAQLVAAAPIVGPQGPRAVLVVATPLTEGFLRPLAPVSGVRAQLAVYRGSERLGTTLDSEAAGQLPPVIGDEITLPGGRAQTTHRTLSDDSGAAYTLYTFASLQSAVQAPIQNHLQLGLFCLAGATLLLVVLVSLLAPSPAADSAATQDLSYRTPTPVMTARTIEALPVSPPPLLQLKFQTPPAPSLVREPPAIDFPSAPSIEDDLAETFAKTTLPSHPAPAPAPTPMVSEPEPLPSWATSPLPPTPPPPRAEPSLFDAIASAAITAPPPPSPTHAPISTPFGREDGDLPVPKEGLSPEIMAAQRAASQRAAHVAAPPPPPVFSSTGYDPNLPAPKGASLPPPVAPPRGVSAPSLAPRPTMPPSRPTEPPGPAPIALAGSAPRAASSSHLGTKVPPLAPIPLPGGAKSNGPSAIALPGTPSKSNGPAPIPLPGRSASTPGGDGFREAPRRGTTVPGESPPYNPSSLPFASTAPAPAPARSTSTLDLPKSESGNEPGPFDEDHYRVVYNEFVASKARLGEAVDNITYEGFRQKLRSSEQALLDRHQCRAVRFQVLVKDKTVSLRPQLVR